MFTRCKPHNVYLSSSDGELPRCPTTVLHKLGGGLQTKVVVILGDEANCNWPVDGVEVDTGIVRTGDKWAFTNCKLE